MKTRKFDVVRDHFIPMSSQVFAEYCLCHPLSFPFPLTSSRRPTASSKRFKEARPLEVEVDDLVIRMGLNVFVSQLPSFSSHR